MGCGTSQVALSESDIQLHKEAERELAEAKKHRRGQAKVLLLGSGDSGKSTVLKQMRLIHRLSFSPQEIENYRHLIFENIKYGISVVAEAMEDMKIELEEENRAALTLVRQARDLADGEPFPIDYLEPLKRLRADQNIQSVMARGNEAALPEQLDYFLSDLDRLFDPTFVPNEQDILRCRARTIGITETVFVTGSREILMVDVGGQKSERRKWIHCFQDVTCLLFVTSLNGYDQCLVEDHDANQMQDSMSLWDEICGNRWFVKTSIILFLNKEDLFTERIKTSPIRRSFPDFDGQDGDVRAGKAYFRKRFTSIYAKHKLPPGVGRMLYPYFTTATDTKQLSKVMMAVEDMILVANLEVAFL